MNGSEIWVFKKLKDWDFPGGPVVRTPSFHYKGPGFDAWLGS